MIFRIIFTINYFPDRIPISYSFLFLQVSTLLLYLLHIFFFSHLISFFLSFFFFLFLDGWDGVPVLQDFWPEVSSTCV